MHGPLGAVIAALAALPVDDIQVETSTLEDYVLRFYTMVFGFITIMATTIAYWRFGARDV